MVTSRSADRPADVTMRGRLGARQWLLDRKLSRRNPADFARVVLKALLIRVASAATCFVSMLFAAWIGAFVRVVSAQYGQGLRSLNGAVLLSASEQAGRSQVQQLPVLISWALLLLLTPAGFTIAFRAAAGAAGILGYLHFPRHCFRLPRQRVRHLTGWQGSMATGVGMRAYISFSRFWLPVCCSRLRSGYSVTWTTCPSDLGPALTIGQIILARSAGCLPLP